MYIRVSGLLFQRSAPSQSPTATTAVMINGSLPPVDCLAELSAPPPDLVTGWRGSVPFYAMTVCRRAV
jgi:hypothetical protein